MTDEQKELDRKFHCAISTIDTEIQFLRREKTSLHGDNDLDFADLLESSRNIFLAVHKDWRAHIGDPIIDTNKIIADLLHKTADRIGNRGLAYA